MMDEITNQPEHEAILKENYNVYTLMGTKGYKILWKILYGSVIIFQADCGVREYKMI